MKTNINKKVKIFLAFSLVYLSLASSSLHSEEKTYKPTDNQVYVKFAEENVLQVSSGPTHNGSHYRLITILVEVNVMVYYQQIEYGDENCCHKIKFTKEISDKHLEGYFQMFDVKDISWPSYDTVSFLGNSTRYTIKLSEKGYTVKKATSANDK